MVSQLPKGLITEKERIYFGLILITSILAWALLFTVIFGSGHLDKDNIAAILTCGGYVLAFSLFSFIVHGLFIGHLRGNALRISEDQFPDVHARLLQMASRMGFKRVPAMYVLEHGGMLNAFATRFIGRNYVVILSEVFELAYEHGEEELDFVIAHELAHLKRGHLKWRFLTAPGRMIPFLGKAYSRACEYTCDRFGCAMSPQGAANGLMCLVAGKVLFRKANREVYLREKHSDQGFWVWFSEILASHPHIPRRIAAVEKLNALSTSTANSAALFEARRAA